MRLKYSNRSRFLPILEIRIRENTQTLYRGNELVIEVDAGSPGYPGDATVCLDQSDSLEFSTDFEHSDPTRFPARMRAAATALRNCGCSGSFRLSHRDGIIRIQQCGLVGARLRQIARAKESGLPTKIGLISCVKEKLDRPARAEELYISNLFKKSKFYAEQRLDKYFILSAKYGLLQPDDVIDPYDLTLKKMRQLERKKWAKNVMADLRGELMPGDRIVFQAGEKYREYLEQELADLDFEVATPFYGFEFGPQLSWYKTFADNLDRVAHLDRFYSLIRRLNKGLGGPHKLGELDSAALPQRGVYFFFEPGEFRKTEPFEQRVVRVGTHCLKSGGNATLWSRLRAHRGNNTFGGNHRSSVFRHHVGLSLINLLKIEVPSWELRDPQPPEIRLLEKELEILVSQRLCEMSVIWLAIEDEAGPHSDRAIIERNSIALLSTIKRRLDTASMNWLGNGNPHPSIQNSSLWNVDHVHADYDPQFLETMEAYVEFTITDVYNA